MKKSCSSLFVKSAIALALTAPMLASAESQLVTGNATATGAAASHGGGHDSADAHGEDDHSAVKSGAAHSEGQQGH